MALLARRLPAPRARLDRAHRGVRLPRPGGTPELACVQRRLRADDHRVRVPPVLRPQRRADLRPSLASRRSTMRARAMVAASLVALAMPTSALAHANLLERKPNY